MLSQAIVFFALISGTKTFFLFFPDPFDVLSISIDILDLSFSLSLFTFLYTFFDNMRFDRLLGLAIIYDINNFVKFLKPKSNLFFFLESFNSWESLDSQNCFSTTTNTSFEFRSCLWNIISKLFVSIFKSLF